VTKYRGRQIGDTITGTIEAEVDDGVRTNKWVAFRDE
jgi:hypothetical protein